MPGVETILADLVLDGAIGWRDATRLRAEAPTEATLAALLCHRLYSAEQRESLVRPLAAQASPWELLVLGVHGLNSEGEDLPTLGQEELRRRQEAVERLRQTGSPSPWLRGYAGHLVSEARRRRGVA